jgi:WhiB family redox-sensing transcriptional regulator
MVLQLAPVTPRRWQDAALCAQVDPDIFFPERGESTRAPKQVCAGCPVRLPCLDYALEHEGIAAHGIWGGLSERERRGLKRDLRVAS